MSEPRRNGVGVIPDLMEVSPVQRRIALKPVVIPHTDPQPLALRKVVDAQLEMAARINAMDSDLAELGARSVVAFVRTDKRLDLLDQKIDERFDLLEEALGLAKRAKLASGVALDEIEEVKEQIRGMRDEDDEVTSPGFARPVTRTELEVRELQAKLAAAEKLANEAAEEAKESRRARRNLFYGIIASLIVAAITGAVSYGLGHAHGAASTEQVVPR